jgi:hypothetical protein
LGYRIYKATKVVERTKALGLDGGGEEIIISLPKPLRKRGFKC